MGESIRGATFMTDDGGLGENGSVETWLPEKGSPPIFIAAREEIATDKKACLEWTRQNRTTLDTLILEHGAIVLRNLPLVTAHDFDDFVRLFPSYGPGYTGGGAPRARVTGNVMESTRVARESVICLHQEMAYLPDYPSRLAFFCIEPALTGGETIIGDMREFTRRIPARIRERLEQYGVRGVRNFAPAGRGRGEVTDARDGIAWDESFQTSDKSEVETICRAKAMEPVWRDDGGLAVITYLDPFSVHPMTGERLYRSIIHTSNIDTVTGELTHRMEGPLATGYTFGDGTALTIAEGQELHDILDSLTVVWEWRPGDLMILDNLRMAHGRRRYTGERETVVALLG